MPFQIGGVSLHDDGQHTGSAKRAVASGVASLDAAALLPDAQNPAVNTTHIAASSPHTGHLIAYKNTYVGNATANKAIAHGKGSEAEAILIVNPSDGISHLIVKANAGKIVASGLGIQSVTAMDANNFYVGNAASYANSANVNLQTYYWFAV